MDTVKPQLLSYSFLAGKPLSLIATAILLLSYMINFKNLKWPVTKSPIVFLVLMMLWISLTTWWAHYPKPAAFKYEVAVKTMIFALMIPFALDSRRKIECVLWVFIVAAAYFVMTGGIQAMLGGGGYGVSAVDSRAGNSGITETSTLSAMCVVMAPIIIYLYQHSLAVKRYWYLKPYLLLVGVTSVFAIIGTYARTGLVAAFVLVMMMFWISKRKGRFIGVIVLGIACIAPFLAGAWIERMSTIKTAKEEGSALGRLVVWRWTWEYAKSNPLGGGFYAYKDNAGQLHLHTKGMEEFPENEHGKAFHSMVFELLGEHGYPGIIIYFSMVGFSVLSLRKLAKSKEEGTEWLSYLSTMLFFSITVYCIGGLFIGIAFEPWLFYLLFISISLNNIDINRWIQPPPKIEANT